MEIFSATLSQMAVLLIFIALGFIIQKTGIFPDDFAGGLSKLENYFLIPAVIIKTFMTNCTLPNLKSQWQCVLYSTVLLVAAIAIGLVLAKIFANSKYERSIYTYSFTVANFSFMGIAVVNGAFGNMTVAGTDISYSFVYMMFILPLNLFVYTAGVAMLTPGRKFFSVRSFVNPIFIAIVVGIILGLTDSAELLSKYAPFIYSETNSSCVISSLAACMAPLAMIITGFVIGRYNIVKLLKIKKVYIASAIRLIIIPAVFILVLKALNAPYEIQFVALAAYCMPLGLNTVVIPEAYGGDTSLGASMALISHTLGAITIPLMYLWLM